MHILNKRQQAATAQAALASYDDSITSPTAYLLPDYGATVTGLLILTCISAGNTENLRFHSPATIVLLFHVTGGYNT
jgi:hypothetical protein